MDDDDYLPICDIGGDYGEALKKCVRKSENVVPKVFTEEELKAREEANKIWFEELKNGLRELQKSSKTNTNYFK